MPPLIDHIDDLRAFIDADPDLATLRAAVDGGHDDTSHALDHLLRVALWTLRIGGGVLDRREAVAAALLHDLVNVPKDDPRRCHASSLSAEAARPLVETAGFDEAATQRIVTAIRQHSFSRGETPTEPLAMALQDADRLEALGAIGIMRCAATGERMGARFFHPDDPFALRRQLDDRSFSVDHFFAKLLRLPTTMCTARGRREAQRRAGVLVHFLESLPRELGEDGLAKALNRHIEST